MSSILDSLWMSIVSMVMAFAVLVMIALALGITSHALRANDNERANIPKESVRPAPGEPKPLRTEETDEAVIAAIMATLNASGIEIPSGGRIHVEKVSRHGE